MRDSSRAAGQPQEILRLIRREVAATFLRKESEIYSRMDNKISNSAVSPNIPIGGETAYPVSNTAAEGVSTAAARSDHVHDLTVVNDPYIGAEWSGTNMYLVSSGTEILQSGTSLGKYNIINFYGGSLTQSGTQILVPIVGSGSTPSFSWIRTNDVRIEVPAATNGGVSYHASALAGVPRKWWSAFNTSSDSWIVYHYNNDGTFDRSALTVSAGGIATAYGFGVNGVGAGVDGTFTTADAKTVTVTKGIITSIV